MNANLFTKKIEMSKSEAKEAGKLNTEKFHELRQFMAAYPGYEVQIKAPAKRKVELRGLDYKYMRTYILSHDDEQHSKMETFKTLIAQDKKRKFTMTQFRYSQNLQSASGFFRSVMSSSSV